MRKRSADSSRGQGVEGAPRTVATTGRSSAKLLLTGARAGLSFPPRRGKICLRDSFSSPRSYSSPVVVPETREICNRPKRLRGPTRSTRGRGLSWMESRIFLAVSPSIDGNNEFSTHDRARPERLTGVVHHPPSVLTLRLRLEGAATGDPGTRARFRRDALAVNLFKCLASWCDFK